jgi:F-type H+-transporting ATPase subunit a
MIPSGFFHAILLQWGPFELTGSIAVTWILTALLTLLARVLAAGLRPLPGNRQTFSEAAVMTMEKAIEDVLPGKSALVFPFVATLWIFILSANLIGLVPGFNSPTSDLSVTAALAVLVFLSVHWFGIRAEGIGGYLRHYVTPSPFLLPFHLISELSRTLALAVRLFGNMMSLEIAAVLVLMVAGFLVPIPLLMLHIVEAVIQAYLFGMLALIYIAGGIQSQELRRQKKEASK